MTFDELVDLHVSALQADTEEAWSVFFESLVKHYTKEELEFLNNFIRIFSCETLEFIETNYGRNRELQTS